MASASPYLASILATDSESLVFSDMSNDELELLISFLYTGFVTFSSQNECQSFKSLLYQLGIELPKPQDEQLFEFSRQNEDLSQFTSTEQNAIFYELQTVEQNEVSRILAEIISDLEHNQGKNTLNFRAITVRRCIEGYEFQLREN